jgi:hypothetical protein
LNTPERKKENKEKIRTKEKQLFCNQMIHLARRMATFFILINS